MWLTGRSFLFSSCMKVKEKLYIYILLALNFLQWFSIVETEYGLPQLIKYLLSVFALAAIIYYRVKNASIPGESKTYDPVIIIFIIWSFYLLFEASLEFNDVFYIQRVLGQRYFYLPYLLPLIILYTRFDLKFFAYFIQVASVLIVFSILIQIYVMGFSMGDGMYEPLHRIGLFDIGSGLALLISHLYKKKYVSYLFVLYFMISIFLYASFGRRGLFVESILMVVAMIAIRLKSSLTVVKQRMILYFSIFLFVIFVMLLFEPVIGTAFIFQRGFGESAIEASRGQVFSDFFADFVRKTDWIFGRGLDGHVLRTIAVDDTEQLIENGFLTIILKGGLLYLIPMLIIMLRASFLGFYRSNNDLSKALATVVFIHFISMMMFGLPDYSSHYVIVWVAVAACLSTTVRLADNQQVFLAMNA